MPATWVPWPPTEMVSVSLVGACWKQASFVLRMNVMPQAFLRFWTTVLLPSAAVKNGCVPSTPESMTAMDTPVPSASGNCAAACSLRVASCAVCRW
jgi:hypothetical protein